MMLLLVAMIPLPLMAVQSPRVQLMRALLHHAGRAVQPFVLIAAELQAMPPDPILRLRNAVGPAAPQCGAVTGAA